MQTHKRFKRTLFITVSAAVKHIVYLLFIRTKHDMQIFQCNPLHQATKRHLKITVLLLREVTQIIHSKLSNPTALCNDPLSPWLYSHHDPGPFWKRTFRSLSFPTVTRKLHISCGVSPQYNTNYSTPRWQQFPVAPAL